MLQRAANNTYSWWWASHIRTKQSKWMEQNLHDMEEKVTVVLKLIEEDGDSFARRAEMYYKKRPELIYFVQESYRAYRALAERYDHLSTELQNANSTIASCFPEQLPFAIEDEDEFGSPKFLKKLSDNARGNFPIVPKVPKPPVNRDSKGLATSGIKRKQHKITSPRGTIDVIPKSGLSKIEGTNEIHRLQKRILALQTEKEFARSTYESAMGIYWELDGEIQELHEKLCGLEDEFGEGKAIADDEARIIMEVTALKSCRDTLAQLEDKQARSATEARVEKKRIKVSREKLDALKNKFELIQEECIRVEQEIGDNDSDDIQKRKEIESLKEKIKQQFEDFFGGSLSVAEMEEKIDQLVNNVISLKSLVASQTVLVHRLRTEIDMFEAQIEVVEDDGKVAMIDVKKKIREMEEKLHEIEDLSKSFEDQNNYLQTHFTEASCNLCHLSEKVHSMIEKLQKEKSSSVGVKSLKEIKEGNKASKMVKQGMVLEYNSLPKTELEEEENSNGCNNLLPAKLDHHDGSVKENESAGNQKDNVKEKQSVGNQKDNVKENESVATSNQSYFEGIENKEKNLLMQYSSMLRNYKDTEKSKKHMEVEANNQDNRMTEIMLQLKELEKKNAMKDELIRSLKEKIGLFPKGLGEPIETQPAEKEVEQDIDAMMLIEKPGTTSEIEDKFRADIDELLEENLDFWFRFSSTFQEVNKFKARVKDLSTEVSKIEERRKQSGGSSPDYSLRSDMQPLYKHLKEVHNELTVWMGKGVLLKDELKDRFSSLCEIQEEITRAVKESAEDDEFKFTSLQAAKFQGEILNMKQENIKVANEVQAGFDNVTKLQLDIERTQARLREDNVTKLQLDIEERTQARLREDTGLSRSKNHQKGQNAKLRHFEREPGVPLSAFIFGGKLKKQKTSIFHRMNTGFIRSVKSCKY